MRPPPFILVLKSNAPGSSETAITKGGRIMFREKKSGAEMENMAALWTSVFWSRPSPARAPQRRHPGLLGPPVPCIQSSHTGRHRGSAAGFLFLVCKGTAAFSFSADKVGPGFRPEIVSVAAAGQPGGERAPPPGGSKIYVHRVCMILALFVRLFFLLFHGTLNLRWRCAYVPCISCI